MALKKTLSEYSREKLLQHINEDWFKEVLEVLRNNGSFIERGYTESFSMTQMEHQALNSSFRQGFLTGVEFIPLLLEGPKEKIKPLSEPFGQLKALPPDPKTYPKPEPAK